MEVEKESEVVRKEGVEENREEQGVVHSLGKRKKERREKKWERGTFNGRGINGDRGKENKRREEET